MNKIKEILESNDLKDNLMSFYIQTYETYAKFYKKYGLDEDLNNLFYLENIYKIKELKNRK